jgi:hypothetical protein
MRIMGYFDDHFEPSAPFLRVVLRSKSLGLSYPLGFHVDTGSSVTIVFDKDVELLGVDVRKLRKAERDVGGVGGMVDTYVVEDAELLFRTEDRKIRVEKLRLFVGKHDLEEFSDNERDMIMLVPSLLGRDLIHKFRLVCDKRKEEVYLEK